jgi:hypothetical protein
MPKKKRAILAAWWGSLLPYHSCRLFEPLEPLDAKAVDARLANLPVAPSVYVLLPDIDGDVTPVYIGKADCSTPGRALAAAPRRLGARDWADRGSHRTTRLRRRPVTCHRFSTSGAGGSRQGRVAGKH